MSEEKFTTTMLSSGVRVTINEVKGTHLFAAMSKSKGDTGLMMSELLQQSVVIYGKLITEDELSALPACDVLALMDIIGINMGPGFNK